VNSLRTRLFGAIALTVAICVALTVAVGIVLTRRAVDRGALRDLSHQADLIAGSSGANLTVSANFDAYNQYFDRQHERWSKDAAILPTDARRTLKQRGSADGSVTQDDTEYFFAARTVQGRKDPFILLRAKNATADRMTPYVYSLLIAAVVGGALAAAAAYLLARRIARPVGRVAEASRELARGEHPAPVPVEGGTELETLASAFNDLAVQLARAREAERSFLLSVSHELKTPLTAIRGYAEAVEDGAVDPKEAAATVQVEAARLERLVKDLLDLARMNRTDFSVHNAEIDLVDVVEDAVRRYQSQADSFGVTLTAQTDGAAPAIADADRVLQVVSNLVENALRLTPAGGEVRVAAQPGTLRVEDTGPGLGDDERAHAFERFYLHERYGRERAVGTGLGLAIVKELTEAMGGSVEVESVPGRQTAFTVRLRQPLRVRSRA
jgi:two-component system sensor histidine kinase BaeS